MLACGSSDGSISILSSSGDGTWETKKINNAHTIGCNAVSWAPSVSPGSLLEVMKMTREFLNSSYYSPTAQFFTGSNGQCGANLLFMFHLLNYCTYSENFRQ
ncbi:protein SEC13 homolog [Orbicella faveolata]|uniref:protein SEC13 homolog n=1 Tax=Orbicella faveolata TaxID=48498 RepID=UPI0009E3E7FE|nr:protein SEC13 homolog [Orbicella faveolata]